MEWIIVLVLAAAGYYVVQNHNERSKVERQRKDVERQDRTEAEQLVAEYRNQPRPSEQEFRNFVAEKIDHAGAIETALHLYRDEFVSRPMGKNKPYAKRSDAELMQLITADKSERDKFKDEVDRWRRYSFFASGVVDMLRDIISVPETVAETSHFSVGEKNSAGSFNDWSFRIIDNAVAYKSYFPRSWAAHGGGQKLESLSKHSLRGTTGRWQLGREWPRNTAFKHLVKTIPRKTEGLRLANRFSHMHVLAGSGSGKTVLLEHLIAKDLEDDCCVVVIDSQTQLIPKLANLDIPLDDIAYITPKHDLSVNMFDVGFDDLKGQAEADEIVANTIDQLEFVLTALVGAELSSTQRNVFYFAIQLAITIPGANINTFFEIITEGQEEKFAPYVDKLDQTNQDFFYGDYRSKNYNRTKAALRDRMRGMLRNPIFRRMFVTEKNTVNMFKELATRRLILIDTNSGMLGEGCGLFGRLFISMILRATRQRFSQVGSGKLKPVYMYVDEAHEYFDRSIERMLEQARKSEIGLILSHQTLRQAREKGIEDAILENTNTKLVSTNSKRTATTMAGFMKCDADWILNAPKYKFALFSPDAGNHVVGADPGALKRYKNRTNKARLKIEMENRFGGQLVAANTKKAAKNKKATAEEAFKPDDPELI